MPPGTRCRITEGKVSDKRLIPKTPNCERPSFLLSSGMNGIKHSKRSRANGERSPDSTPRTDGGGRYSSEELV